MNINTLVFCIIIFIGTVLGPVHCFAQQSQSIKSSETNTDTSKEIVEFVDVDAEPPGGYAELSKYIRKNLHCSGISADSNIIGSITVSLIIKMDGGVGRVEVIKNSSDCDDEIVTALKSMPKWKPAEINHQPVPTKVILPIKFQSVKN